MLILDLFSGIGGFSLGLEKVGFKTIAFCEIDKFFQQILRKHWPDIPIFEDVRKLSKDDIEYADIICGGFPCQDLSVCGKRAGLEGKHSGLWTEFARLIGELRPKFVIVENVPGVLVRGFSRILSDLADVGYDAEWEGIPAAAVGASHYRARQWLVAYPSSFGDRLQNNTIFAGRGTIELCNRWESEPKLDRVANGIPHRVDRIAALGNAIVPKITETIGKAIIACMADDKGV